MQMFFTHLQATAPIMHLIRTHFLKFLKQWKWL